MKLFLFTEKFPYGKQETFLENELPFLTEKFEKVIIIPLYKQEEMRKMPHNVDVWQPILAFNPKNRKKLIRSGIFNLSPIGFAIKEFFVKRVYTIRNWLWSFFTSLLLFRVMYANKKFKSKLCNKICEGDKLYFYWGYKSSLLIPYIKKRINNKYYVRFHGSDLYEKVGNGYIPFRKYLFSAIDWIMPISENGKKYLIENYPFIASQKIHISRLGVFDNGQNADKKDSDTFHLLSCSNVIPLKRIHLIIEALQQIEFNIKWTHIGSGILFENIKKEVELLPENVTANIVGMLSNKEVMRFYQQNHIDLFINVSNSEGVPVSIMEAFSFGVPTIATDVGGTSEIVDDTVGKLLDVNISGREIAETIELFSKSDLSDIRQNARNRWNERSNAERNYREFVKFMIEN